jgi:hypothetical protein
MNYGHLIELLIDDTFPELVMAIWTLFVWWLHANLIPRHGEL